MNILQLDYRLDLIGRQLFRLYWQMKIVKTIESAGIERIDKYNFPKKAQPIDFVGWSSNSRWEKVRYELERALEVAWESENRDYYKQSAILEDLERLLTIVIRGFARTPGQLKHFILRSLKLAVSDGSRTFDGLRTVDRSTYTSTLTAKKDS